MPKFEAPMLYHNGKPVEANERFGMIGEELNEVINHLFSDKPAQREILRFLITNKSGSFAVSEKNLLRKTGFSHTSYINARKDLVKGGWITLKPHEAITVNINELRKYEVVYENDDDVKGKVVLKKEFSGITALPESEN